MPALPRCHSTLQALDSSDPSAATSNRQLLKRVLARKLPRATLLEADNGAAAVATVRGAMVSGSHIDVVLMDREMPEMDGLAAARALRDAGWLGVLLGVTGHGGEADIAVFVAAGADGVLPKPVTADAVIAKLEELIAARTSLDRSTEQ